MLTMFTSFDILLLRYELVELALWIGGALFSWLWEDVCGLWLEFMSVNQIYMDDYELSSLTDFYLCRIHVESHQWSEWMINLGRLVHGIEYHPNMQVNALLSIPSEFTLFFCRSLFTPVSFCPLLGYGQQISRTTCGLNTQHLINVLLKDYPVSLGFSMIDKKTNKISNSTNKVNRKWKQSATLFKIGYFREDIGMHRMYDNIEFIL
jgi:hypothetical protein